MNMLYALDLPNGGAWSDPRTLAGLAHLAEESGWDGVFLVEICRVRRRVRQL